MTVLLPIRSLFLSQLVVSKTRYDTKLLLNDDDDDDDDAALIDC
jgi:hypothetical protein